MPIHHSKYCTWDGEIFKPFLEQNVRWKTDNGMIIPIFKQYEAPLINHTLHTVCKSIKY